APRLEVGAPVSALQFDDDFSPLPQPGSVPGRAERGPRRGRGGPEPRPGRAGPRAGPVRRRDGIAAPGPGGSGRGPAPHDADHRRAGGPGWADRHGTAVMFALPPLPSDGSGPQVTGISCPDCAGVLEVEIQGRKGHLHFRCRIRHGYSLPTLLVVKEQAVEDRLWAAVTAGAALPPPPRYPP